MHDDSKAPAPPNPAEIDKILEYEGARSAFEKLCEDGCERQWLTSRVLSLPEYPPPRKRKLFVSPKTCRRLEKQVAGLLRGLKNLDLISWHRNRRKRQPSAEHQPAIVSNLKGSLFPYQPRSPVIFDVNLLLEQLQAASKFFGRVGKAKKQIVLGFEIHDMYLRMLLSDVKKYTRRAHYREIAVLCTAATKGRRIFDEDALKEAAYYARKK